MLGLEEVWVTLFLYKKQCPDGVKYTLVANADCYDKNKKIMLDENGRYELHSELSICWTVLFQTLPDSRSLRKWDETTVSVVILFYFGC